MKNVYLLLMMLFVASAGFAQPSDSGDSSGPSSGEMFDTPINGFSNLSIINELGVDLTFSIMYEYDKVVTPEFTSVSLKYTVNKSFTDEEWIAIINEGSTVDNGLMDIKIGEESDNNMYTFAIPSADLNPGDVVRYYFMSKIQDSGVTPPVKEKEFYSPGQDADFNRDIYSQWASEVVVSDALSEGVFENASVSLYPNPVINKLNFKSSLYKNAGFEVFGVDGKLLISEKGNLAGKSIDVSGLNRGNYILKVSAGSDSKSYKFTK
ncbi:MAG: T9SS type A sorting domain-containing protein [Bacteroidota bacterium]